MYHLFFFLFFAINKNHNNNNSANRIILHICCSNQMLLTYLHFSRWPFRKLQGKNGLELTKYILCKPSWIFENIIDLNTLSVDVLLKFTLFPFIWIFLMDSQFWPKAQITAAEVYSTTKAYIYCFSIW